MNAALRLRVALALAGRNIAWLARKSGLQRRRLVRILDPCARPRDDDGGVIATIAAVLGVPTTWVSDPAQRLLDQEVAETALACMETLHRLAIGKRLDPRDDPNVRSYQWRLPHLAKVRGARSGYRVAGASMSGFGLLDGDLVFVRPMAQLRHCVNSLVVCRLNERLYLKQLILGPGRTVTLRSANIDYRPIVVEENDTFELVGRVILTMRDF